MRTFILSVGLVLAVGCNGGKGESTGTTDTDASSSGTTQTPDETTGTPDTTVVPGTEAGSDSVATTVADDTVAPTTAAEETTGETTIAVDTSTGDVSTSTGEPDPGPPMELSLLAYTVYANCQPNIEPDPIIADWNVLYDNTANAEEAHAELIGATLTLLGDADLPFEITAEPTMSGPVAAGETLEQAQVKQAGLIPIPGCTHCDKPFSLALTFASGGEEKLVMVNDILSCAF